jgi:hypothetical protein
MRRRRRVLPGAGAYSHDETDFVAGTDLVANDHAGSDLVANDHAGSDLVASNRHDRRSVRH